MSSTQKILRGERTPRRTLEVTVVAIAIGTGLSAWLLQGSGAVAAEPTTAPVERGELVVAVGGVGRIVLSTASSQIAIPSSGANSASSAPADAIFPRSTGRIARFLVQPGQKVKAGQVLAILDDGGTAADAIRQAGVDLATATLELRQRRTSDPLRGVPATPSELAAAHAAVTSASERLAGLLGPRRRADVSAARLDVKRAEADLETGLGGSPAARARAIRVAERAVEAAQKKLERLLAPPAPADVAVIEAEVRRAEADLALLKRPSNTASAEALATAQQSVASARHYLGLAMRSGDNDEIRNAMDALESALDDLAVLLRPGPGALPVELVAAEQALIAARAKLERLLAPPPAADVAAAKLELERAQSDLGTLRAGPGPAVRAAAQQAVDTARAKLAQLLGKPLSSDVTAAKLDLARAQADLAVLRARGGPASATDVALAGLKRDAAQIRLASARHAERMLTIRAPWSGTVTSLLTVPGAPVDPTTPVLTVADLSRLGVMVELSEFDAAQVRRGLEAVVSVDALGGEEYEGEVVFASPTGIDKNGVVIFPVRVGLASTKRLKPGMNVSVRIIVNQKEKALQVPLEAVTREEDEATVEVVNAAGETAVRRVVLGLANNQVVEIVKGLRGGERVLLPEPDAGGEEE